MTPLALLIDSLAAMALGMVIGLERQWRHHPAGLKTNSLVCLGAALYVAASQLVETDTRIAAQVVSGIGFLAGGVIIKEGLNVRGMNTAATLWCAAAVGVLAGYSRLIEAGVGTLVVLAANIFLRPLSSNLESRTLNAQDVNTHYRLRIECSPEGEVALRRRLVERLASLPGITLTGVAREPGPHAGRLLVLAQIDALSRSDSAIDALATELASPTGVHSVEWDRAL